MSFFGDLGKFAVTAGTAGAYDGSGGGWAGGLFKQGEDPGKAQLRQVLAELARAKQESAIGYAKAGVQAKKAIPLVSKAFDDASGNSLKLAENTKRQVVQNQDAQLTGAQMQVNGTGYDNSNMGRLAARGVYGDTARALTGIDDLHTQHQGQLALGKATALSGIQGNLADIEAAGANAQSGLSTATSNAIAGVQHIPKKSIWDLIGGVAKVAAPFVGAGGGGGGYTATPTGGIF